MTHVAKFFLMALVITLTGSCSKIQESPDPGSSANANSNNSGGGGGGGGGGSTTVHLTCKVDGTPFEAQSFTGSVINTSISLNGFSQGEWSYPYVGMSLPVDAAPGDYSQGLLYAEGATPNEMWTIMTGGSIKVTSHDKTKKEIKGTFSGTVQNLLQGNSKELTEGSFYLKYQ